MPVPLDLGSYVFGFASGLFAGFVLDKAIIPVALRFANWAARRWPRNRG